MISVIIPVYKNKELFLENLRHNLPYLNDCEIIIVNDNPTESLKKDLEEFKKTVLIENTKNLGFGESINCGAKKAQGKYLMLLNSDVRLLSNNYQLAINNFKNNPSLFSVTFAQKEKDGAIVGKNRIFWQKGLIYHTKASNLSYGVNAWAEGGSCLIDKEKFDKLGGFDKIYFPFYWEDIDLSYRAWQMNYQVIFEPRILVEHHHESTIAKYFSKDEILTISFCNQFLFIWKNINDISLKINHLVFLPYNLIYYSLRLRQKNFFTGFLRALKKISQIKKISRSILNDKKIFYLFR